MAEGIQIQITAGGGGTPVTYSLERQIDGGGYSVVNGSIPYTASPQTYADDNGGSGFSEGAVVDYRATATNTDGTSSPSTVESHTIAPLDTKVLIYQSDIPSDGIADFVVANGASLTQSGNNLLIGKGVSATVRGGFNLYNANFIPPHNTNWIASDIFTAEVDIAAINGGLINTFLVNQPDLFPMGSAPYTEDNYLEVTGKTNGSLGTICFEKAGAAAWADGVDTIEISEVRVYKTNYTP